jgi:hypothetical protein
MSLYYNRASTSNSGHCTYVSIGVVLSLVSGWQTTAAAAAAARVGPASRTSLYSEAANETTRGRDGDDGKCRRREAPMSSCCGIGPSFPSRPRRRTASKAAAAAEAAAAAAAARARRPLACARGRGPEHGQAPPIKPKDFLRTAFRCVALLHRTTLNCCCCCCCSCWLLLVWLVGSSLTCGSRTPAGSRTRGRSARTAAGGPSGA